MVSCGTISVQGTANAASVVGCSADPDDPFPDEEVTVSVDIRNNVSNEVCVYLEFVANGQVFADLSGLCVTIPAGDTVTETEAFTPADVGASGGQDFNYEVNIVDADVGPFNSAPARDPVRASRVLDGWR